MDKIKVSTDGFLNRKENPLPLTKCCIKIIISDTDGDHVHICSYTPFNQNPFDENNLLGTAKIIYGKYTGIAYNVWKTINYEFLYYQIIDVID